MQQSSNFHWTEWAQSLGSPSLLKSFQVADLVSNIIGMPMLMA